MSPVLKRKREKFHLPSKYLLFILTLLCISMMVLSFTTNFLAVPLNYVGSFLIVPFEKGLTSVGTYALEKSEQLQELSSVLEENERLKETVLLVDDIKSTGATLDECTRALMYAGVKDVYCITAISNSGRNT